MKAEQFLYVLRNTGRKKKQTFFSILCICISSFVILTNMALNNGLYAQLKQGINEAIAGQLTVYRADNPKMNLLESQLKEQQTFAWPADATFSLQRLLPALSIDKRIRFGSLISLEDETSYVNVQALEPAHLERIGRLLSLAEGTRPDREKTILISESMANDLHCAVGDTVLLVAENIEDYMSDETAVVSGIFKEKGLAVFFQYTAFIPYESGKEIVRLGDDECLELILNPPPATDLPEKDIRAITERLRAIDPSLSVASWEQTVPLLFTIANIWKGCGYFTQGMFMVFSLLILTNLTSLVISSRKKEFGTLLAIGFSWRRISSMVCVEYLWIGTLSVGIGWLLAAGQIALLPDHSLTLPTKDLQSAVMAESIRFFIEIKDILYVWALCCFTLLAAVGISLSRMRRSNLVDLIMNR